ncbi:type II toxin-antitoxin system HicA family toxin [Thermogemmata fonticola]|uniref:Type II toxin-antitoxin system HicA family toxin n=1 Tax=Thermogemmata fonticola TaxID=2755323 RepID=A0A7V9AC65_9BACT|nr:type II toxin-antitoxin system HicA family toxin [Thermogemmata fonticola]
MPWCESSPVARGKLRVLSGQEVCLILERHGFRRLRQRGSHIVMQGVSPAGKTTTVPVPNHKELRTGTLLSIIRQSGVPRSEFEERPRRVEYRGEVPLRR